MQTKTDLIAADVAVTLDGLFHERARRAPDKIAYRHFDEHRCEWRELTWREMEHEIARWQVAVITCLCWRFLSLWFMPPGAGWTLLPDLNIAPKKSQKSRLSTQILMLERKLYSVQASMI